MGIGVVLDRKLLCVQGRMILAHLANEPKGIKTHMSTVSPIDSPFPAFGEVCENQSLHD
jgi:hypothetical protein